MFCLLIQYILAFLPKMELLLACIPKKQFDKLVGDFRKSQSGFRKKNRRASEVLTFSKIKEVNKALCMHC